MLAIGSIFSDEPDNNFNVLVKVNGPRVPYLSDARGVRWRAALVCRRQSDQPTINAVPVGALRSTRCVEAEFLRRKREMSAYCRVNARAAVLAYSVCPGPRGAVRPKAERESRRHIDKARVAMPAMPRARLAVVAPEVVLGSLEASLTLRLGDASSNHLRFRSGWPCRDMAHIV